VQNEQFKKLANRAAKYAPHSLSFRPSRPFDFFLWLEHGGLDSYVVQLATQIDTSATRRKRDAVTQAKFQFSLKLILLNLLAAHKVRLKTLQAIPLRSGEFSIKTRYDQRHIAYRPFIDAYNGLLARGLIREVSKGFHNAKGKGKLTRIEATTPLKKQLDKLLPQEIVFFTRHPDEENIRLRNQRKKLMDYSDSDYAKTARENLPIINQCLNRHWYDLDMTDAEFDAMYRKMAARHKKQPKKPVFIQFHERSLYRIFNNGDISEGDGFAHGGRFYGGWWEGVPEKYRHHITINGKRTVEIDYSAYHPRMLYALEGKALGERDPYLPDGLDEQWRDDFGKLAFTKLLNGKGRLDTPEGYDADAIGMTWKELLAVMEEYHAPIAKYFRTGYGLELMRKDSDIAENILLHFTQRDIPCLPVHDSFIVHHAHADELWDMMLQEYERVFEQGIGKKVKDGFNRLEKTYAEQFESPLSIDEMLQEEQAGAYWRRLNSWWEYYGKKSSNR